MSVIIQGSYTSDGAARTIELPSGCDVFEIYNYTAQGSTANPGVVKKATWLRGMAAASAFVVKNTNSAATDESSAITSGGFTYFDSANLPTYNALTVSSITQASAAVVTTSTSHGYATGDYVIFTNVTAMHQIDSMVFQVTVTGSTTFTIPINTSGFAAAASGGSVRKIATPGMFTPRVVLPTAITAASSAVVSTNIPHGYEVGGEVSFRIPSAYGMTQLDGQTGKITAVTSTTFTVNIDTSSYTAFAYPTSATAAAGVTQAQVVPAGSFTQLTDQAYNNAVLGITLGTSVVGASSDVVYYVGYKAQVANS